MILHVDWSKSGWWRVRNERGELLGEFRTVAIYCPARTETYDEGKKGRLVCLGELTAIDNETGVITDESATDCKGGSGSGNRVAAKPKAAQAN